MGTNDSLMKKNKKLKKKKSKDLHLESVELVEHGKSKEAKKKRKNDRNSSDETKSQEFEGGVSEECVDCHDDGMTSKSKKTKKRERDGKSLKKGESMEIEEANPNEVAFSADEGGLKRKKGKSKEAKKKRRKEQNSSVVAKSLENEGGVNEDDVYLIPSDDEDCPKGMKKWISDYYERRPGFEILQQRIDEFMTAHEEKLEQERKEREERVAEGGWTVVTHRKGRKKTTEAETGTAVGSVAQAVVEDKLSKKKSKQVGLDFYRFQKKEAHRNDIMTLQNKFKEDMKRVQQLRAARKFRPY